MDIRTPIGLMFLVKGLMLVVYGSLSKPEIYQRSLGLNVNLSWGGVMLVFGLIMFLVGWRAQSAARADG